MRNKSSARFEPYYKVQWRDDVSLTWRDIQKSFSTVAEAEASFTADKTCRVMEITMQGRHPLPIPQAS